MAAEQAYHEPRTAVTPPRPCAGFFSEVSMETGCESSQRRGMVVFIRKMTTMPCAKSRKRSWAGPMGNGPWRRHIVTPTRPPPGHGKAQCYGSMLKKAGSVRLMRA